MAQASLPNSRPQVRLQAQQAAHLPVRVTTELRRLEGRIRTLSVLSGLALAIMAISFVAAIAFVLDYWLDLSGGDPDQFMAAVDLDSARQYVQNVYSYYTIYRTLYGTN